MAHTIGLMMVNSPILLDVDPDSTPADALKAVKSQIGESVASVPGREAGIRFTYLGDWTTAGASNVDMLRLVELVERPPTMAVAANALTLSSYRTAEGLRFTWVFKTDSHSADAIENLSETLLSRLRTMADEGSNMMDSILAEINLGGDED
jgi:hypothetical protein